MKIDGVKVIGPVFRAYKEILTPEALRFLGKLARNFEPKRQELLEARKIRQKEIDNGKLPDFLKETEHIRNSEWTVASIRPDLERRVVELTGPVDRKMIINALNSRDTDTYMPDFEDSSSPTWKNMIEGQINLRDAINGTITYTSPEGKKYEVQNKKPPTLIVRPRGLHLNEEHVTVDGKPISAMLFDHGLYHFHNAKTLIAKGSGPYSYIPKFESHLENRWLKGVSQFDEDELNIPKGYIRATNLIETILAVFEMDEMLYELKDYSAGLNAGRWDKLFSFIKKLSNHPDFVLPDRGELTMDKPPLNPYLHLLTHTAHKRGIHGIGGMVAKLLKGDPETIAKITEQIIQDKLLEANAGADGAWAFSPGVAPVIKEAFEEVLKGRPHQIENKRPDVKVTAKELLTVPQGKITEAGLRKNVKAPLLYLEAWLRGVGCIPIDGLMEDAATVEISRSQLWQWLEHKAKLDDGRTVTMPLVKAIINEELQKIKSTVKEEEFKAGKFELASKLLEKVINKREFTDFITLEAYPHIVTKEEEPKTETKEEFVKRIEDDWKNNPRWEGIKRPYSAEDVWKLRGTVHREFSLAKQGAKKLWDLINKEEPVRVLSALTGNQAIQEVQAGLNAIYISGWQVAADMNNSLEMYPDQSLYTSDSMPTLVKRINNSLIRADQITHLESKDKIDWLVPLVADAEAGFGRELHTFELIKQLIKAGASGIHLEDQDASIKKCGHLGGKGIIPTSENIKKLVATRLATDVLGVPTIIIARTDAGSANLLTSDVDPYDKPFVDFTKGRSPEGYYYVKSGLDQAIARGLAYAPYADMLWFETSTPNIEEAKKFADAIHAKFPEKLLAYNCSPSFNWRAKLDDKAIAEFQKELGKMGYKFQFVTLSGFHVLNHSMFELAKDYKERGMLAYADLQNAEFNSEKDSYEATKHQRFVGTGYFDEVAKVASGGKSSTLALQGSTEEDQFHK